LDQAQLAVGLFLWRLTLAGSPRPPMAKAEGVSPCGEVQRLLYWTMLAAGTVGPGTVVTCARAGAEYGLQLIWPLLFASLLAYTLQERAARFTIVSGRSVLECLRASSNSLAACWGLVAAVAVGNTLYECNNWAGGIDALQALPSLSQVSSAQTRVIGCLAYALLVVVVFFVDAVDRLGVPMGLVMMAMIAVFFQVAMSFDISGSELIWGFVPNFPAQPSEQAADPQDMILSLTGTTALGFNIFLGSEMAKGKQLAETRRGLTFSTLAAFLVSVLVLIVGAGAAGRSHEAAPFSIAQLAASIRACVGEVGATIFATGFVAAAFSSMLTVVLGALIVASGMLFAPPAAEAKPKSPAGELPLRSYWAMILLMIGISALVVATGLPRVSIILVAQVINGILLPVFCTCLLVCLQDAEYRRLQPHSALDDAWLHLCVGVTYFLACRVIVRKLCNLVGWHRPSNMKLFVSASISIVALLVVLRSIQSRAAPGQHHDLEGPRPCASEDSDELADEGSSSSTPTSIGQPSSETLEALGRS